LFVLIDPREQVTQVISGELPPEGPRGRDVAFLEADPNYPEELPKPTT
jgi:hypothetical protein